jgi:hypothetical protein
LRKIKEIPQQGEAETQVFTIIGQGSTNNQTNENKQVTLLSNNSFQTIQI